MQFLSSKLVHDLQMAFSDILDKERVKQGQTNLQRLKQERQFELALATFISRSSDYHKRLLAILQLQKKLIIQDMQTVWSLKQVYFGDSDKIAEKIRKIITLKQNIKMASEFLVVDVYQTGSSVCRQIQMVFSMLKHEDKAQLASQYHFKQLCLYLIDATSIIQNHQPCFFMLIVSLALFYQSTLKNNSSHFQEISTHWKQIQPKCSSSQVDGVFMIYFSIKQTIFGQNIEYKHNSLGNFLRTMFCKRSQINIDYFSKCWSIIGRYGQIVSIQRVRQQFIESMVEHNRNLNKQMLSNIKIYGTHNIQLENQMFVQDNNELLIRQVCNRFINSIFSQHYQWLNQSYLIKQGPHHVLQILLAMINHYNSIQLPNLQQLIPTLFQKVCSQLEKCFSIQDLTAPQRNICITYIDFLTKCKAQIQLSQLSNMVDLLAKISQTCPILSPFCDTFLSQIWKQLTCLQINQLIEFIQFHLQRINENEWAIRFERYECFLRLAVYLQQSSNYFSTCTQNDSLFTCILKSHQTICELLKDNRVKIDFEVFHIFLSLTKSIIQNKRFKRDANLYNKLNIPFLIDKIQKHLFLNEDTAIIVSYYRYHTKIIVKCLKEQKEKWEIDQLDYTYRISLYLAQIQFASQLISQIQLQQMRKQLELKIVQFIKELSSSQFQKMKSGKFWDKLENVYNISKYVQQKMDIESI